MDKIEEGNKLIAEFMQFDIAGNTKWIINEDVHPYGSKDIEVDGTVADLKYHTSRDWLMPVVEKITLKGFTVKIETVNSGSDYYGNPTRNAYDCQINKCWWENQRLQKERICGRRDITSLIEVVHNAVIDYITWYNQTNQPLKDI